jgi:hypothetical protein
MHTTRFTLGAMAVGTALIAAWLTVVILLVVPERSPAALPVWIAIDILASAMVVLSAVWLGHPSRVVLVALRIAALAAVTTGIWLLFPPGGGSEGYEVLIGGWLVAHAVVVALVTARRGSSVPATRP